MKNGKLRIVIGILLVLIQLLGVTNLETTNIDLYDTKDNTYSDFTPEPTELNLTMWLHGFYAGREKWGSVFMELPEALAETGYYYHVNTSTEFLSARIRENLTAGGHSMQKLLYDLNLWIGFYLFGILGAILLISGFLAWRRREYDADGGYMDSLDGKLAAKLRIPGAVICGLCLILQLPTEAGLLPEDILPLFIYGCMGVFFLFYYGKKPSVLPTAVLLLWGAVQLEFGLYNFCPMVTADTETQLIYYFLSFLLYTLSGILYLVCGGKLYKTGTKKKLKWLFSAAGTAELLFYVYYISEFRKFPRLMMRELIGCLPSIMFILLVGAYIWLVKDQTPAGEAVSTPSQTPLETPTQPPEAKFCRMCGKPLGKGYLFCGYCGTQVLRETSQTGKTE